MIKQTHFELNVNLWTINYTALSSGDVLIRFIFTFSAKKKKKYKQFWIKAWTENTGERHVLLKTTQQNSKWKTVFMLLSYAHVVGVQEQKEVIQSICQWLVQSLLHSRPGGSWYDICQRRGSVSLHSLQDESINRTWTFLTKKIKKYIHTFKKCMWIEPRYRRGRLYRCNRYLVWLTAGLVSSHYPNTLY